MADEQATRYDDQEVREAALRRLKKKRDFSTHLVSYVIINAVLVLIWYLSGRGYFWPMWVMIGWGIGLAFNGYDVYLRREITEADIQREMQRSRRE
ncbi:MAG: 2TM domain-containing protein [Actinobacteria bacterium]|jgi:hypothetical protein|nr:2TM domain-containing protein [Actinomycetota bacterium]